MPALFGGKIGSAKRCLEDAAAADALAWTTLIAGGPSAPTNSDVYGAIGAACPAMKKTASGTQAPAWHCFSNVCSASLRGSEAAQSPVSPARATRCAGEAVKNGLSAGRQCPAIAGARLPCRAPDGISLALWAGGLCRRAELCAGYFFPAAPTLLIKRRFKCRGRRN